MSSPPRVGNLSVGNNLADVADPAIARTNIGAYPISGGLVEGPVLLPPTEPSQPNAVVPRSYVDEGVVAATNAALAAESLATQAAADAQQAVADAEQALNVAAGGPIIAVGSWNASANTPTIVSGNGTPVGNIAGRALIVIVAGTTSVDGVAVWGIGDSIVWNGSSWFKAPYSNIYVPKDGGVLTNATVSGPSGTFDETVVAGNPTTTTDPRFSLLGSGLVFDDAGNLIELVNYQGVRNFGPVVLRSIGDGVVSVSANLVLSETGATVEIGPATLGATDPRFALLGPEVAQDSKGAVIRVLDEEGVYNLGPTRIPYLGGTHILTTALLEFSGVGSGMAMADLAMGEADPRFSLLGTALHQDAAGAVFGATTTDGVRALSSLRAITAKVLTSPVAPEDVATREYVDAVSSSPWLEPRRDYGAIGDGVADDSVPVNQCIAAAVARGDRFMSADYPYNVPTMSNQVGDLIVIGHGALLNATVVKYVVPPSAPPVLLPPPTAFAATQCPSAVAAASTTGVVRMVITGDSVSRVAVMGFSIMESMATQIQDAFVRMNPGVVFQVYNRGIGGGNWAQLDTVPVATTLPAWYTNPTGPWLDEIEPLQPHIMVVSAARNGGASHSVHSVISVRNKVALWSTPCDIIATTSMGETQTELSEGSADGFREGYEYAAGSIRSYFLANGLPVLDTETVESQARFGYAQEYLPLLRDGDAWGGLRSGTWNIPLPFTLSLPVYGYGGQFRTKVGGWTSMGNTLIFELSGARTNAMKGNKLFLRRNPTTFEITYEVTVTRIADGASIDYTFIPPTSSGIYCDDSSMAQFYFAVQGSRLYIYFAGTTEQSPLIFTYIPRTGSMWTPTISCAAGSVPTALEVIAYTDNFSNVVAARPTPEVLVMPELTDREFASPDDIPALPWGGNGPHGGALSGQRILRPAINVNHLTL